MPAPFVTPVAVSVPFEPNRNPQYGGNAGPSSIVSTDVQSAIEEVKTIAIGNDRWTIVASYGGNANTGRYLEIFPGTDSLTIPIFFPTVTKLIAVVIQSTDSPTGTISWYDLNVSSTVPVYSLSLVGTGINSQVGTSASPLYTFPAGAKMAVKISAGSINKPSTYFYLSSSI